MIETASGDNMKLDSLVIAGNPSAYFYDQQSVGEGAAGSVMTAVMKSNGKKVSIKKMYLNR